MEYRFACIYSIRHTLIQRRDIQGRFTKRRVESKFWVVYKRVMVGCAIVFAAGVVSYDFIDNATQPIVYVREAHAEGEPEEVKKEEPPQEVLLKVITEWDEERIVEEIRTTFPDTPNTAVAVAKGESRLNANAYNPEAHRDRQGNVICYGSYGVMQIGCVHMQENPEALYDVATNLEVAKRVYQDSLNRRGNGWLPWGVYTDGNWRKHL